MKHKSSKKKHRETDDDDDDSTTSSSSSSPYYSESDGEEIERSSKRHKSRQKRRRGDDERRRREKRKREKEKEKRRGSRRKERRKHSRRSSNSKKSKRDGKKKRYSDSDSDSGSGNESEGSAFSGWEEHEEILKCLLKEFPGVASDLEQLLKMIDDGQAVDIKGLSEKSLIKYLRKLFLSLNLKENGDNVFLLPPKAGPTLPVILPVIQSLEQCQRQQLDHNDLQSASPDPQFRQDIADNNTSDVKEDAPGPRKRMIGPEMPSAELLAAAAKLTEAEADLREAELEGDDELFIGPPPPAVVSEVQSANEAERFEEVARIIGAEVDSPYDILGVNENMSDENIKKRYWKLSLMVHPDKCSHPQAHQAFIKLNKAFKDLQDVDKRKALDEKIKLKQQEEEFKADLKAMREAAQWRRLQGISMEGDDILLAEMNAEVGPKRDEWMTTLPPERKPGGMPMHSTTFSKTSREGRGDTSAWTDTPLERAQKAQKAKMNYLEAYNEAAALASKEQEMKKSNAEAELVDQYNKAKRSKSLVEQHKESSRNRSKKKSKQEPVKEEWEGNHPWKPWDREKDLTAGRQKVNFDAGSMAEGLSSRFSSGSFQRSFL